jgi:hypothetical protein
MVVINSNQYLQGLMGTMLTHAYPITRSPSKTGMMSNYKKLEHSADVGVRGSVSGVGIAAPQGHMFEYNSLDSEGHS